MNTVTKRVALMTAGTFLVGLAMGAGALGARAAPVRKYINVPGRSIASPVSDAVLVGDTLYVGGRLGFDASGQLPTDSTGEAKAVLDSMKSVLAAAGMTMDDLVSVHVFCTDLSLFETWNGVYRGYFGHDLPARMFIGSGSLLRGAHFEMQAIAVRR
jgi:2-iminobutanoate/2-iminopropanoate deaminase